MDKKGAESDQPSGLTQAVFDDDIAARRHRRQHSNAVTLTGEQVYQISSIIGQACEVIHCARLLYEFPEEWDSTLRSIRSTAGTIRHFAKAKVRLQLTEAEAAMLRLNHIIDNIPESARGLAFRMAQNDIHPDTHPTRPKGAKQ